MKIKQQQSTFRETQISTKSQIPINNRLSMLVTDSLEDEKSAHKDNESQFNKWNEAQKEKKEDDDEEDDDVEKKKKKEKKKKFETCLPEKDGHPKMNKNYSQYAICQSKLDDNKSSYTDCKHRARLQVALLGLAIAVVNCYAQATFCIAIVEMVLPPDFNIKSDSSQIDLIVDTQAKVENSTSQLIRPPIGSTALLMLTSSSTTIDDTDQSCPIEYKYKDYYDSWRFPATGGAQVTNSNLSVSGLNLLPSDIVDISDRFDWDASRQGLLLGAFAVGTAPLQILGGRLAEIYGAKWVLLVGCIGTAITNLTIPPLAHYSFVLLIINRIVMGISQAGMEPGLMCLMANWLTPSETSFFISMLLFAICMGFFLGSLCSSFLLTLGCGWPLTYYVAGGMNLVVGILWFLLASSKPRDSKFLSKEEVNFIEREQQLAKEKEYSSNFHYNTTTVPASESNWKENIISNVISKDHHPSLKEAAFTTIKHLNSKKETDQDDETTCQAPWMNLLSSRAVWAFIICKISIRWSADVVSIELPTYLANVLHLSIKLNGIVNSISSALFAIFSFITGYFVNEIANSRLMKSELKGEKMNGGSSGGISKTNLRKLVQSIASFGSAIAVFMMTQYDCNILFSMSMLFVLSCSLVMGTGGELQIPYDMTSRYPGTLHGMACTLSVSGWLAPPLIGLILGERPNSRYRWSLVWYMTALINFIGGLVFVLFADASPRDFDRDKKLDEKFTHHHHHRSDLDKHNELVRVHEDAHVVDRAKRCCNGQAQLASYYNNLAQNKNSPPFRQVNRNDEQNSPEHAELEKKEKEESLQAPTACFHLQQQQQQQQQSQALSSSMMVNCSNSDASCIPQELYLSAHEFDPSQLFRNKEAQRTKRSGCCQVELPITIGEKQHNWEQQEKHMQYKVQYHQDHYETESVSWRMKQNAMWRLWTRFLSRGGRRGKFSVISVAGGGADSFPVEVAAKRQARLEKIANNKLGPSDCISEKLKQTAASTPTSGQEESHQPTVEAYEGGNSLEASALEADFALHLPTCDPLVAQLNVNVIDSNRNEAKSNKFPKFEKVTKTITHL